MRISINIIITDDKIRIEYPRAFEGAKFVEQVEMIGSVIYMLNEKYRELQEERRKNREGRATRLNGLNND